MHVYGELLGTLTNSGKLSGKLSAAGRMSGILTIPTSGGMEVYDGPYEFTPSEEAQTIDITYKTAMSDITINAIPSNYGLITWDGTKLTVS